MIKNAIWLGASALALSIAGCDDGGGTTPEPSAPSLRILGTTDCGRVFLPTVQPEELRNELFRTMALTVNGRDPGAASGQITTDTEVVLEQTAEGGDGAVAFISAYQAGRASNLNQIDALGQAGSSFGRRFVAGIAADQIICVTPGQVRISARVADYNGSSVATLPAQTFVVTCQPPAQYDQVCGDPQVADMAVDLGGDMGPPADGGVLDMAPDMTDRPVLWSVNFVPPANPQDLEIGIRNSGLGRRDSVPLQFVVTELDTPLGDLPIKFVLSNITQPGVTISAGNEAVWEDQDAGESIVLTNGNGVGAIRVLAGGTPGLAVVRAVGLRLPANRAERAQLFADAECPDDGGEGYDCMFEAYCRRTLREQDGAERETYCQADRSAQVGIVGGIPSGRGMQLDCADDILPAFTRREGTRWLLSNEPGTDCELQVADRVNGRVDGGLRIQFLTEAGTVRSSVLTDDDGRAATHLRVGSPAPRDVRPDAYETQAGFYRDGYNPRDGLVRIVAFTKGEEDFNDTNGDKIFTPGTDILEPGHDLPEPFLDVNDNGEWDDGEEFRDANNDGVWTDANGEWDSNTEVWVSTTVLWVGELFSCFNRGGWTNNPDCGCLLPDGSPAEYDCEDNVGQVQRDEPAVVVRCGDQGCNPPLQDSVCAGTPFELQAGGGGQLLVRTNFFDVNGNCLNARNEGSFDINPPPGMNIIGTAGGDFAGLGVCFSAFEKPLGQSTESILIDTGMGGGQVISPLEISLDYLGAEGAMWNVETNIPVCRLPPAMGPLP